MAAKKPVVPVVTRKPAAPAPKAAAVASTPVRNTPVPKVAAKPAIAASPAKAAPAKKQITHDDIARKAFEIWASGKGGSEYDNWIRAERELRGV